MKKRYIEVKKINNSSEICNKCKNEKEANFVINVFFDNIKINYFLCEKHFKDLECEILEGKYCYDRKRNSN